MTLALLVASANNGVVNIMPNGCHWLSKLLILAQIKTANKCYSVTNNALYLVNMKTYKKCDRYTQYKHEKMYYIFCAMLSLNLKHTS